MPRIAETKIDELPTANCGVSTNLYDIYPESCHPRMFLPWFDYAHHDPETCMMDVEAHHECSIRDTMAEILAIESRRHFDEKPNIYSSGLRCVFGTGRGQAKHLGDLY